MKKISYLLIVAVAMMFASCNTGKTPKANLKTEIDSLSYAEGMVRSEGLSQYLAQMSVDSVVFNDFYRGFKEGITKKTDKEKAYVLGLQLGQTVANQWVEIINAQVFQNDSLYKVDEDNLIAGFYDGATGKNPIMDMMFAQAYVQAGENKVREMIDDAKYGDNRRAGENFLAENKDKEGVITTESGLQYKVLIQGNGPVPSSSSSVVNVNYVGRTIDGEEFDSSAKHGDTPAQFPLNRVIRGWTEVLQLMPVGSKWEVYVPQELAYGPSGQPNIPPYSTLIFEIELVSIEKN